MFTASRFASVTVAAKNAADPLVERACAGVARPFGTPPANRMWCQNCLISSVDKPRQRGGKRASTWRKPSLKGAEFRDSDGLAPDGRCPARLVPVQELAKGGAGTVSADALLAELPHPNISLMPGMDGLPSSSTACFFRKGDATPGEFTLDVR